MDFLEGSLLGPLYSDTLYGERKHRATSVFVFFAFYFLLAFFSKVFPPAYALTGGILSLVLFFVFSFLSPFLSERYYRFSLLGRFGILFFQLAKRIFLLNFVVLMLLSFSQKFSVTTLRLLFEATGNKISDLFTLMSAKFNLFGLMVTGFFLMFVGILFLLFFLLLMFFLPNFFLFLSKKLERMLDKIVNKK